MTHKITENIVAKMIELQNYIHNRNAISINVSMAIQGLHKYEYSVHLKKIIQGTK